MVWWFLFYFFCGGAWSPCSSLLSSFVHHHDHLHRLNIHPVRPFCLHHCPRQNHHYLIKNKNQETMKPTGKLKNRSTKKPYSPQISSKTTTFYLHESWWQKQLKEAILYWTSGCKAPQKIGKTTVIKCKRSCKRNPSNGYNSYTSLAFFLVKIGWFHLLHCHHIWKFWQFRVRSWTEYKLGSLFKI